MHEGVEPGVLGETVEESWDRTRLARRFHTPLSTEIALATLRQYCEEHGWEIVDEPAQVHRPVRAARRGAPSPDRGDAVHKCSASKWISNREKLEPLHDDARRRMAAWVLRDLYPHGVGRGGYAEVYYRYVFEVSLRSIDEGEGGGTEVTTIYEEGIDPYGGGIPDKSEFWVRTAFDTHDPFADIEDALTSTVRD